MGISGLLPVLKSITENKTLADYKGQTLAIDGYCWLHRAIYCCSQELCLGQDTDKYVNYFMDRVAALLHHGIIPYVVFDGGALPMKQGTEEERRRNREKNREMGVHFYQQRNYAEARKCFARAADVTPYMAHRVIQRLKQAQVSYVVAPYEADAQLAYLVCNGFADGVITEDSDCLPFGCRKVLFKLDRDGIAQEICLDRLKENKGLTFHMFTHEMFLEMCIFSGCDYLDSIPGFGLKKAYAAIKQHGSFSKIVKSLRLEGKVRLSPTYEADFERALLTFRHQRVYNPTAQRLVTLTPIPADEISKRDDWSFLGPEIPPAVAKLIADGDMDPISRELFGPAPPNYPRATISQVPSSAPAISTSRPSPSSSARKLPQFSSNPKAKLVRSTPPSSSAKAHHTPPQPTAKQDTTPLISRFFAKQTTTKCSPVEDEDKCASQVSLSSFESQEALDVDVTRSISFSPLDDTIKHMGKENTVPVPQRTAPPENAFMRMMKAGSMLQKQSLKRKAPPSRPNAVQHIRMHAFKPPQPVTSSAASTSSSPLKTRRSTLSFTMADDGSINEPESCPSPDKTAGSEKQVIARGFALGDRSSSVKKTSTDAFAKFRFTK
ncbi:TPA: hypothetical protein N0F65_012896 [Lagenidium giganteum]|uniref:Exonuclease 1 n=1 Tax=Lagenidium giganteum TaxID=4803 RepID=A0AAV2YPR5_9STRA|nr:TPA: hypothetical protein N0F65_012896 [Lagenidium giganteum]